MLGQPERPRLTACSECPSNRNVKVSKAEVERLKALAIERGKKLAAAREARGLTQAQVALRLGLSKGTVGGWESGAHGIRGGRLGAVSAVYGLPVAELVA